MNKSTNKDDLTLKDAIDLWLSQQIKTTRESYKYPIRDHMNLVGPALPLSEVSTFHMMQYSKYLEKRGYAIRTLHKHVKTTKTFWNWCTKMELVDKSPARVLKTPNVPRRISRDAAMTDSDLSTILAYLKTDQSAEGVRNYALAQLIGCSGTRAGGAAALRIQDIDFENLVCTTTQKGDKTTKLAITHECAKALREWLIRRPITIETDFCFISLRGKKKPLTANYIGQLLRRAARYLQRDWDVSVKRHNAHSMRHRLGHRMFDERINPALIATALNHSSVETTLATYAPDDWESASDAIREQAVSPAKPEPKDNKIIKLSS